MKFSFPLALLFSFFLLSTGSALAQGHSHEGEPSLSLNKGEKWKVKDNMMVHIANSQKAVQSFEQAKKKDYAALASTLDENIGLLVGNCSMKGKAHDELHKWLMPYMGLVDELSDAKNTEEAAASFHLIQHSFEQFYRYFQ